METRLNKRVTVEERNEASLNVSWHFHPEFEILYIPKGSGLRFVGNHASAFEAGELVLLGGYLPHLWRNDSSYYESASKKTVQTIVIKFTKDFIGNDVYKVPLFRQVNELMDDSKYGILFSKKIARELHNEIITMSNLSSQEQHIELLKLLHKLSIVEENQKTHLSTEDLRQSKRGSSERIDRVLSYISNNYDKNLTLEDVANIACMTTNSFCRFFKKMTNKSFTQFLNEIRIKNATGILVENDMPVSQVGYDVGFNSVTNFNKQFKLIMGFTPKEFREAM